MAAAILAQDTQTFLISSQMAQILLVSVLLFHQLYYRTVPLAATTDLGAEAWLS